MFEHDNLKIVSFISYFYIHKEKYADEKDTVSHKGKEIADDISNYAPKEKSLRD